MKKLHFILIIAFLVSCGDNIIENNCFSNSIQPLSFDLNNPQLNGLLTPNGSVTVNGGMNGIVLFNKGTGGTFSPYIAIDRKSPNRNCNEPMIVNPPVLKCSCDASTYSMLDGSLISGKNDCNGGARVYTVTQSGSTLQISN
ncbi:hypothetical protein [Tenacibaculum sp. C7A-26P2]|uniref:hypothetical protein n=1 Tax=Tenacibaculum sp. C7A-26P2 TaxID=3447504 RepID=UPI003F87725B